jgi:hypothetical protein
LRKRPYNCWEDSPGRKVTFGNVLTSFRT